MPGVGQFAAVYLRVSTDHQRHSLLNQSRALNEYARRTGCTIVKRYVDEGKSGLNLNSRPALKRLLADMFDSTRKFDTVLVYNVSRWGRFQDLDEASHYEFLCQTAGIQLRYCEEDFPNDGCPANFVFKTIRRALAAEYSRHLSEEIFAAQRRGALLGYKMGGSVEFGLGRSLVSPRGQQILALGSGDRKILKDQRVIHILGPKKQVECVRQIFNHALRGKSVSWIVDQLNQRQIRWLSGKQWTTKRVRNVLGNELFAGYAAWGRTSRKLKGCVKRIPTSHWAIADNVLPPLVSKHQFDKVQTLIRPVRTMSNDLFLERLRKLLTRTGRLSGPIIDKSRQVPSRSAYIKRFGSLARAYTLIGYDPPGDKVDWILSGQRGIDFRNKLVEQISSQFPERMTKVKQARSGNLCPILLLDQAVRISVRICRQITIQQNTKWTLKRNIASRADLSLLCLLTECGSQVAAYYLYPHFNSRNSIRFVLGGSFLSRGCKLEKIRLLPEAVHKFLLSGKGFALIHDSETIAK
jgi:DNA invertase Pin-like site-specific DNA recombinase